MAFAATFDTTSTTCPTSRSSKADPLIINRLNPLDAHAVGE
jgi:oxalate decarboxylase